MEDEFSKVYHIYKDKLKNKLVQVKEKAKNGIKWLVDSLLDEEENKSGSDAISKQVEEVKNLLTSSVLFDNKLIAKEENVITRLNESVQSLLSRNKRVAIDTEKIKNETIKKFLSKNSVLFRSILPNNPMIIGLNPLKIIEDSKLDKTLEQLSQIETTTEANQASSESVDEAVETTDEVSKKPKGFLFKVADSTENEALKHEHELLHESDSENMSILNLVSNNGTKGEEIHSETHEQDESTENAISTIEVDVSAESTTTTEIVTPSTPLILSSMDLPPSVTNLVEFKQAEQTTLGSIVEFSAETTTESSTTTTTTLEPTTTELITEPITTELITEPTTTELVTEIVTTNLPSTTTELLTTTESTTELIITETTTTTTTTESTTTTTIESTTASTTELVTTTTELTTTSTETSTISILETTLVETTPVITTESTTTESLITETTTIPTTSFVTETESTSTISVDTTVDIVTEAATITTPVTELITETTTTTQVTELITTPLSETTTISTLLPETTTSATQSTVVLTTSQVLVESTLAQANATVKANVTNGLENDIKFEVLNYTVVNASAANDSKSYSLRLHIKGYKWNEKFNNVTSLEAQEFMRKRILPLLYKHLNVSHDELNEVKLLRLFKGGNNGNKSRKV